MESIISLGIHFLLLCTIKVCTSQSLPASCNPDHLYNYGTCRSNGCPRNESFIPGPSHCDNFRSLVNRNPVSRCAPHTPCCVWGGVCRRSCQQGQSSLGFPSDCTGTVAASCCIPTMEMVSRRIDIATPTTTTTDRNVEVCGNSNILSPRIAGGRVSSPTDWPWVVRILFLGPERSLCQGVLVDGDTVLTVAHCVQGFTPHQLQVVVGDYDLTVTDVGEEVINVRSVEISPNFAIGRRGGDMAVLKLARSVEFSPDSNSKWPICLPTSSTQGAPVDPDMFGAGVRMAGLNPDQCFVAGWGLTENGQVSQRLRSARVQLLNKRACNEVNRQIGANIGTVPLPDDIICTDTSATNSAACSFDDGAMLACRDVTNRFVLIGLASEYSCGRLPTLFTRMESYADAIRTRLGTA